MRWHSRVDKRTWMAFVGGAGRALHTGEICQAVWPRKQRFDTKEYARVRAAALEFAEPVRRGSTRGRPWLWRLKSDSAKDD
jgi:hypothetical protein